MQSSAMMDDSTRLHISINGKLHSVRSHRYPVDYTLHDYLYNDALLTGTKSMCKEGGCGACTVVVYTDGEDDLGKCVNSCLVPLHSCDGWSVTTVEGLGDSKTGYHPIQQTLADNNGSQCGFCSPGMVMSMYGALQSGVRKTEVEAHFDGNICRCTGYRPIMDSMQKCVDIDIEDLNPQACSTCPVREIQSTVQLTSEDGCLWLKPHSEADLQNAIAEHAGKPYKLVAGNSSSGVYKYDGGYQVYIDITNVKEFKTLSVTKNSAGEEVLVIGCCKTISELISIFTGDSTVSTTQCLTEAARYLLQVANPQVRNLATWSGNLMIKHRHREFVSDVFVLMDTMGALLDIYNTVAKAVSTVSLTEFLQLDMTAKYIRSAQLLIKTGFLLQTHKTMPIYRNALTAVSLGLLVKLDLDYRVTQRPNLVYTGINKEFTHASDIEEFLNGKLLTDPALLDECQKMIDEYQFTDDVMLPSANYRRLLTYNLLQKAILSLTNKDGGEVLTRPPLSSGTRSFPTDPSEYPLTQPIPKLDSVKQTAGESQFVQDLPAVAGQVQAVFATSTIGAGEIGSIDVSDAEKMPGVLRIITAKDIPGENLVYGAEPLLCDKEVSYYGQPIAIVVAETERQALAARTKLMVKYTNIKTPVLTIQQAKEAGRVQSNPTDHVKCGDAEGAFSSCDLVLEGTVHIGEQYAMHMELQQCVVYPQEGFYIVYSSTQSVTDINNSVCRVLGIESNLIDVYVRRVGGGFGGKQFRATYPASAAALSSFLTQRPVRMCLTLEDNMEIIGRRNPFRVEYKVGVTKDLKLMSLAATIYENVGFTGSESGAFYVAKFLDAAYYMPHCDVKVYQSYTNQPCHSFLRNPGICAVVCAMEQIMDHVAFELEVSGEKLREANMYREGQITLYGDVMSPCYLQDIYNQLKSSSQFDMREAKILQYNKEHRWRKKAIAMMPVNCKGMYIPFAEYLVHVMVNGSDGSVTVIHGGVELGQGINTKVIQVVAKTLGVPMDKIKVQPTSSAFNLHSGPTGASHTSDMNCTAVQKACEVLLERLKPHRQAESSDWLSLITRARDSLVDLHSKYYITYKEMDRLRKGNYAYKIYGAACTEIELDCLTGNYIVNRVDLLYDAGKSYSPEIDVGQIEGAFVMGMGHYLHEEIKYDPVSGKNITNNTWNYHVPLSRDIPVELNVKLLPNSWNDNSFLGAKAVGEPPMLLGQSVLLAIKKAVVEFRKSAGNNSYFSVDSPFTTEKILLACHSD